MKTFNFSHLASHPAPMSDVNQVLSNLEALMRKHSVNLSITHISSREARSYAAKRSPLPPSSSRAMG